MSTNAARAIDPLEVRFTHEEDLGKYGDGWYRYDEMAIMNLPVRELIALEAYLGMPIVDVMNGVRASTTLGDLAGCWLAVHLADPGRAGNFASFEPHVMWLEWRKAEDPKDEAPTEPGETTTDTLEPEAGLYREPEPSQSIGTSEIPPTVVLQTMPVVESGS